MRICSALLIALLSININIPLAVACDPSFTLANYTPWTIRDVYTRETGDDGCSNEQLGESTVLAPQHQITLNFYDVSAERFDIKLVMADGRQEVWGNVGLCDVDTVSIRFNDDTGKFNAVWE